MTTGWHRELYALVVTSMALKKELAVLGHRDGSITCFADGYMRIEHGGAMLEPDDGP